MNISQGKKCIRHSPEKVQNTELLLSSPHGDRAHYSPRDNIWWYTWSNSTQGVSSEPHCPVFAGVPLHGHISSRGWPWGPNPYTSPPRPHPRHDRKPQPYTPPLVFLVRSVSTLRLLGMLTLTLNHIVGFRYERIQNIYFAFTLLKKLLEFVLL